MKKISLILAIIMLFGVSWQTSAMVFDPTDFTYVLHLYYDGNKFVPNSGTRFQYDVVIENFEQQPVTVSKIYSGKLISVRGETLASFLFDPKYVDSPVGRGPVEVKAPYFANAKTINIFDNTGKLILTINVGETSVCNENNVCEAEAGEDFLACPSDCKSQIPITPAVSDVPLAEEGGSKILWLILGMIALVSIIVGLVIRKHKKRIGEQNNVTVLPDKPSTNSQSPSNPNVPQP